MAPPGDRPDAPRANHATFHPASRRSLPGEPLIPGRRPAPFSPRAFWSGGPAGGEIRPAEVPIPAADQVLVRTLFSGISRGTETLVLRNAVPPSEYDRMRAPFQDGAFGGPVKYGYSNVGIVEEGPRELVGQVVFCLFPHQTHYVVPAAAVQPLPAGVPPSRAVLAANLETAINGLWDAGPSIGDRICVVGGGVVGLLVGWLAAGVPGCRVELVDTNPARAAVATRLGMAFSTPDAAQPEADLVIHASGNPDGLPVALALAGSEATVLEMSWYGSRTVTVPLGEAFHSRRLVLRSSQVGAIAPGQRARWSHARRLGLALALPADPRLDVLVTGETPFEELPALLARLAGGDASLRDSLCERIAYPRAAPDPAQVRQA
jgi:NADPH:quinone reductase-like Zn-dependent oxidoreductase